jgi:hypothetical protein
VAIRYHYDLYPRTSPRDGARIRRFTKLQEAIYRDVIGVGSGAGVIRSTNAEAADLDPLGEQYIRVVEEDTVAETEAVRAGFWINRFNYDTAVARETKRLTFSGAGHLAYLARARMWSHTYMGAAGAGAGITTGAQDPFDDIWRLWNQGDWAGGDFLGAVFHRVIMEALSYQSGAYTHRHKDGLTYTDTHSDDRTGGSAISLITLGFDKDDDSDGNPWSVPSGEFQASVGENVLSVTQRLMQAGLYVEMDPDTFELRAWENDEHRRDRTGSAWGASVVRFQAPTDATVATGNMLSDSEREINSHLKRTIMLAGGQDSYAKSTQAGDIRWEGFEPSTAAEATALQQLASTQLTAREEAADAGSIRMKLGTSPLSGRYRPWEEVRLDDLVTLHTGTSEWDYDEATYPVAGLKIELQKSGAWWAYAEVGASFSPGADRRFQVPPTAAHTHPPNPELCRLPTVGSSFSQRLYFSNGPSSISPLTADAAWAVGDSTVRELLTAPDGSYTGAQEDIFTGTDVAVGNRKDESASYAIQITTAAMLSAIQAGGAEFMAVIRARSRTGVGIDDAAQLHYPQTVVRIRRTSGGGSWVGTALAAHSGTPGLRFPQQTTMVSRVWEGTLAAVAGAALNDWIVVELGTRHTAPTSGGTGAYWGLTSIVGGSDLPAEEGTATNLNSWVQITLAGSGGTAGDLPLDVVHQDEESVGLSVRAARCDHQHAHGYLSADGTHYHDVDQIEGIIDPLIEGFVLTTDGGQHVVQDHGDYGSTETIDLAGGNVHTGNLSADCTFSFVGATSGVECRFRLHLQQDETGGWVPTFPSSVVWPDDTEPAWSTDPGAVDVVEFTTVDGGSTWYGDAGGGGGGAAGTLDDLTDVVISTPSDGDVLTYDSGSGDWVNEAPPGGGGGLTHSYLGYNTIGGSAEAVTVRRWYAKKITVATAGVITSIGAYVDQTSAGTTTHMGVGVFEDNAGTPRYLLAANAPVIGTGTLWLEHSSGTAGQPRWMSLPIGLYVPAGDYWIGVVFDSASYSVFKDGSGADRYWTHATGIRFSDAGLVAITTTTDRYSIRASHIS